MASGTRPIPVAAAQLGWLAAEMHLKFDAVATNYRKAMREQGLAKRPVASPV